MTLFEVLAQAAQSPARTFREAWFDFERWERARGFVDDPSRPAKAALDWVRDLYETRRRAGRHRSSGNGRRIAGLS